MQKTFYDNRLSFLINIPAFLLLYDTDCPLKLTRILYKIPES